MIKKTNSVHFTGGGMVMIDDTYQLVHSNFTSDVYFALVRVYRAGGSMAALNEWNYQLVQFYSRKHGRNKWMELPARTFLQVEAWSR